MSAPKKFLWWVEHKSFLALMMRSPFFMIFMLMLTALWAWVPIEEFNLETFYVLSAAVCVVGFLGLSSELSELVWVDAFKLLPGFARALRLGALRCVFVLTVLGFVCSVMSQQWMPGVSISYVAAVMASLHLPVWITPRERLTSKPRISDIGHHSMSWGAGLLLMAPVALLHYWPLNWVLLGMAGATPCLLWLMWRRLPAPAGAAPRRAVGSLLREPNLLVCGSAMLLVVTALAFDWDRRFNLGFLPLILLSMGSSAMAREMRELRALLSRLWLLGMSRAQLCRFAMWRLFVALASEYAIYFATMVACHLAGVIGRTALLNVSMVLMVYALLNWAKALDEVLRGFSEQKGEAELDPNVIRFKAPNITIGILVLALAGTLGFAALGKTNSWYGLFFVLMAVLQIWFLVRQHVRRFETAELW